jgi:hypothetical protein
MIIAATAIIVAIELTGAFLMGGLPSVAELQPLTVPPNRFLVKPNLQAVHPLPPAWHPGDQAQ